MKKTHLYGPSRSGSLDPQRLTPADRRYQSAARLDTELSRRTSLSPSLRALQNAADAALGRSGR